VHSNIPAYPIYYGKRCTNHILENLAYVIRRKAPISVCPDCISIPVRDKQDPVTRIMYSAKLSVYVHKYEPEKENIPILSVMRDAAGRNIVEILDAQVHWEMRALM
jgi:hypothetical protein